MARTNFVKNFDLCLDNLVLASHIPIEISSLLNYFLKADKDNTIQVKVTGVRKLKVGLLVTGRCSTRTKRPRTMRSNQKLRVIKEEGNVFNA